MKAFHCDACGSLLFFESVECVKCHHVLGYLPDAKDLSALEPDGTDTWRALSLNAKHRRYRLCLNGQQYKVCNWMVPMDDPEPLCRACRLNGVVPDLQVQGNLGRWYKLELAKRRVILRLLQLGLPLSGVPSENRTNLEFRFMADSPGQPAVMSGHAQGVITLNIAEADDIERERRRVNLHEPYRTLLGHMRHEIAHFYWDRLIANSHWTEPFREIFGDERQEYSSALKTHYERGAPNDWQSSYISSYASAHPWEDWAETGAHYFHILDLTETASSFGMALRPEHPAAQTMTTEPAKPADMANFDALMAHWFPLTYALNTLNRDMGLMDLYPFALSDPVVGKLRFAHEVLQGAGTKSAKI